MILMKKQSSTLFSLSDIDNLNNLNQLPKKSTGTYQRAYHSFMEWLKQSIYQEVSEDALLAYFSERAKLVKSSTVWSLFSMLKTTMIVRNNVDIGKFTRLLAFIKHKNKGYVATKPKVFTKEQLEKFFKEAPDRIYLMMKVALIIGMSAGCRKDDLAQLTIDDIEDLGATLLVKLPDPKLGQYISFTAIPEQADEVYFLDIYRKYCNLRPDNLKHRRFFLTYRDGKCTSQVVGKNTLGKIPSMVADYLQLPEPETYNGHSFRRPMVPLTKSKVFTKEQLQKFLKEAPDRIYLMMKVALLMGISGGCRTDELAQLTIDEVEDLGSTIIVKIPNSKSKMQRSFTVCPEQADELDCLNIYRKYCNLRPRNLKHRRFFLFYKDGKCTNQVIGKNTFGRIPSIIARYLQLPKPESYDGYSFRRSSVSLTKTDRFF